MKFFDTFLVVLFCFICISSGNLRFEENRKTNILPDWALGGFERPKDVNPIITPMNTTFYCPMQNKVINWEVS